MSWYPPHLPLVPPVGAAPVAAVAPPGMMMPPQVCILVNYISYWYMVFDILELTYYTINVVRLDRT